MLGDDINQAVDFVEAQQERVQTLEEHLQTVPTWFDSHIPEAPREAYHEMVRVKAELDENLERFRDLVTDKMGRMFPDDLTQTSCL